MIRLILLVNLCLTLSIGAQSHYSNIEDVSMVSIEISPESAPIQFGMLQDLILDITGKPDSVYNVYLDMDDVMATYLLFDNGLELIVARDRLESFTISSNHYSLHIGQSAFTIGDDTEELKPFKKSFEQREDGQLTLNLVRSDEYISFELEADSIKSIFHWVY